MKTKIKWSLRLSKTATLFLGEDKPVAAKTSNSNLRKV